MFSLPAGANAHAGAHRDADGGAHPVPYGDGQPNRYCRANQNADGHSYRYGDSNPNSHGNGCDHGYGCADTDSGRYRFGGQDYRYAHRPRRTVANT